jgi:pyruvate formate lyase activating enzyme
VNGELVSETYGKVSAIHYDPIEKKPLYHFHPGSIILSIGSIGCNLNCSYCQNCDISRADVSSYSWFREYSVEEIVQMALDHPGNTGIAFTYNEPTISYEYVLEISRLASASGLKTVMVTNGFINPDPLVQLLPFTDAWNVDLKAFREEFYSEHTGSKLGPVLETLKILSQTGKHLEVTNLVIPGLNDDPEIFAEMIGWIHDELGSDSILHLSRYFPHHRMTRSATPVQTLIDLYEIAREKLHYVYLGNVYVPEGSHTDCPSCGQPLIRRNGYETQILAVSRDGTCKHCHAPINNLVI